MLGLLALIIGVVILLFGIAVARHLWKVTRNPPQTAPPPAVTQVRTPPQRPFQPPNTADDDDEEQSVAVTSTAGQRTSSGRGARHRRVSSRCMVNREFPTVEITRAEAKKHKELGSGGEAVVYKVGDKAWKVFRDPSDEFYQGDDPDQKRNRESAARRLLEYPDKFRQFPLWVGARVVVPQRLLTEGGRVIGYEMFLVPKAVELLQYTKPAFKRDNKITLAQIIALFIDLYDTFTEAHAADMIIGDVKPQNMLVSEGRKVYVVDSESAALGSYPCHSFSEKYVDPRLCDPKLDHLLKCQPYDRLSDWYSFTVMLFQCITNVTPWAGVYSPGPGDPKVAILERPLRRISVFNKRVQAPDFTQGITNLPREVQEFFLKTFEKGMREKPSRDMLVRLFESVAQPHEKKLLPKFDPDENTCWIDFRHGATSKIKSSGEIAPLPIFDKAGNLLAASMEEGKLHYLARVGTQLVRETGQAVVNGYDGKCNLFGVSKAGTLLGTNGKGPFFLVVDGQPQPHKKDQVDLAPDKSANVVLQGNVLVWLEKGHLVRSDSLDQTTPFRGPGFLHSGKDWGILVTTDQEELASLYIHDKKYVVKLLSQPPIIGTLVETECFFAANDAWLILTTQYKGDRQRYVMVISKSGRLVAMATAVADQGEWWDKGVLKSAWQHGSDEHRTQYLTALVGTRLVRLTPKGGKIEVHSVHELKADTAVTHLIDDGTNVYAQTLPAAVPAAVA